ncbi:TNT domain-containing protein [Gordonia polyisoprenivorans]
MVRRRVLLILCVSVSIILSGGGIASAAPGSVDLGSSGWDIPGITHGCSKELFNGDKRLGPETLSNKAPVGPQLVGYHRFGKLNATSFLEKWWNVEKNTWNWPDKQGYVLDGNGNPIKSEFTLSPGTRIDRYGSEYGNFLAPEGTPYAKRGLPPVNLVGDYPEACNYHDYTVLKPMKVYSGKIAPVFEQPSLGLQYEVVADLLVVTPKDEECGATVNVFWLRCAGYLQQTFPGPQ